MLAMSYVVMNFCVVFGICDAVTVGTDQRTKNSQVRFLCTRCRIVHAGIL